MSIDKSEAAAALAAADQSSNRSSVLHFYRMNAPIIMMWGAFWMIADLTILYAPRAWGASSWVWPAVGMLGGVICGIYYWRISGARVRPQSRHYYFRMLATWLFTFAFVVCAMVIFSPFKWREPHAFFGVLFGALYAINGVWTGWRLTALGLFMAAGTMAANSYLGDRDFLLFMGFGCGGAMVLAGFWLRKV